MSVETYERFMQASESATEQGKPERADELEHLALISLGDRPLPEEDVPTSPGGNLAENGLLASDVLPLATSWLWEGRLPFEEVVWAFGEGGTGKSYWSLDIASRITNGWDMPDGTPSVQGNVIVVCPEDKNSSTVIPRLMAAGANLSKVSILSKVTCNVDGTGQTSERTFTLPDDLEVLRERINTLNATSPDPTPLVIIDPLMAVTREGVSLYRNQSARKKVVEPLEALADETGVCIIMIAHLNKGEGKKFLDNANGSKGITDAGRVVLGIVGTSDGYVSLINAKNNLRKKARPMTYEIVDATLPEYPEIDVAKIKYISGYDPSALVQQQQRVLSESQQSILKVLESKEKMFSALEIHQKSGIKNAENTRVHLHNMVRAGMIAYPTRNQYCSLKFFQQLQDRKQKQEQKEQDEQAEDKTPLITLTSLTSLTSLTNQPDASQQETTVL